ncbi:MAG: thioredoxin [Tenacibaculum sp.]|nr:thioredoxin [Tenacibaculum sp.]
MKNKNYIVIFALFICISITLISCKQSVSNNKISEKADITKPFIKDVNVAEFKKIIDSGNAILLDVRTPKEVASGRIEGSSTINFYSDEFIDKINLINKSKAIAVYCRSGRRSVMAAKVLQKNGFNKIYNLEGGIKAWEHEGLPLTKSTISKDEHIKTLSLADFEKVLKTNKIVLIDFHTVWCSPCRKMAPIIDEIETEYKDKAVVMRVDVDNSKEIAKKYNIQGVPVFILFKNGVEKWKHNGIISKKELTQQINNKL